MNGLVIFLCVAVAGINAYCVDEDSLQNLVRFSDHFYDIDIDDDGLVEFSDIRSFFILLDTNVNGVLDREEIDSSSLVNNYPQQAIYQLDDGEIRMEDLKKFMFLSANTYGTKHLDLKQYLTLALSMRGAVNAQMVDRFVTYEKNFKTVDISDDGKVSKDEFMADFREADYDQDQVLKGEELNAMRSLPFNQVTMTYCMNNDGSCSVKQVMPFFTEADRNNDSTVTFAEYLETLRMFNNKNKSQCRS